ncbi:MAG TPA: cupredoxin domain-containing protein [Chitinophagaceae bacterium]|nr:cupredoxin domain-containing protein [Chitinophagaceae bacterium]
MKQRIIFTLTMQLLIASFLFLSCSKSSDTLSLNPDGSVRTSGTVPINYTTKITIERNSFTPPSVTVMQSGSLLWVNSDSQAHTVTADDGSFDSGDIQPGASFSLTFNTVGPYPYRCKYHSEATGIVKCVTK